MIEEIINASNYEVSSFEVKTPEDWSQEMVEVVRQNTEFIGINFEYENGKITFLEYIEDEEDDF